MGKVNAVRSAQVLIDRMKVNCVLNVGVVGSVSRDINKCDIVVADKLVQHDFDLRPLGYEKGEIHNVGKYMNCDKRLVDIAKTIKIDTNIKVGVISSGDIFVTDEEMGAKINNNFGALCVEMEGAAVAQVCSLCNIPFLVVRSISDSPYEKNNIITFEEFLRISSNMVSRFIEHFIDEIK